MSFIPGQKYPVAFLLFDCNSSPGNYLNYARSSVQQCFSSVDPTFNDSSEILSGDLLPDAIYSISKMIQSRKIKIDLSRLDSDISQKLKSGDSPGDLYMIGLLFVVHEGVSIIHNAMLDQNYKGYLGMLSIEFVAGTSDIADLSRVLRVTNARIGDRI